MDKIVSTLIFENKNLEDVLDYFKNLSIEIRYKEGHFYPYFHEDIVKYDKKFKEKNIKVIGIHAPDYNVDIGLKDEWERMRSIREIEKSIVTAHYLGAKYVVLHPGSDDDFSVTIKSLENLKEFADIWGVDLYVENQPPYKNGYLSEKFENMVELLDINICFDVGHSLLQGIYPKDIDDMLKKRIKHFHLHNNNGEGDQHLGVYKGKYDLSEFLKLEPQTVTLEIEEGNFYEEVSDFFNFIDTNSR